MMKHIHYLIAIACALFSFSVSNAQEYSIKTHNFSETVVGIQADTTANTLLVKTRELKPNSTKFKKEGQIISFNLKEQKEQWRIAYKDEKEGLKLYPDGILITDKNDNTKICRLSDGKEMWKRIGLPSAYDGFHHKLFWYQANGDGRLDYVNFATGHIHWTSRLASNFGWNDNAFVNDSTYFIQSDGIHLFNLYNGSGYYYAAKTFKNNSAKSFWSSLAFIAGGIAVGLAGGGIGIGAVYDPNAYYISNLCSNVIREDDQYFMADREGISCLNDTLGNVWRTKFPKNVASASRIFTDRTSIYIVNVGFGIESKEKKVGVPFVARYDRTNGKPIYLKMLQKNEGIMHDSFEKGTTEYMIFDDKIATTNLNDSSAVTRKQWDVNKYGKLKGAINQDVYLANNDSTLFTRISPGENKIYLYTERNTLCEMDNDLNVAKVYNPSQCYTVEGGSENGLLLRGDKKLFLINNDGELQETIPNIDNKIIQSGNKAFAISSDKHNVIEITL